MTTKIKKDDEVVVISGRDKGETGKVIFVDKAKGRVIVERVNLRKKTQRATQKQQKGGIIEIEAAIDASNVMLLDPKTGKRSRIGYKIEDGKKVRYSKSSGKVL